MPEYTFELEAIENRTEEDAIFYFNLLDITIKDPDGTIIQQINDIEVYDDPIRNEWKFFFTDWNFDGFADISVPYYPDRLTGGLPRQFWLWDTELEQYVKNEELAELAHGDYLSTDAVEKTLRKYTEIYSNHSHLSDLEEFYTYNGDTYDIVKRIFGDTEYIYDGTEHIGWNVHDIIEEFVDGEWVLVSEIQEYRTVEEVYG